MTTETTMPKTLTVTFQCEPGQATLAFALDCQQRVLDLVTAIADDIEPGAVTFASRALHWVDDGVDEIVVAVTLGVTDGQ